MPGRPDLHKVIDEKGHKNRTAGVKSSKLLEIDMLVKGDVYVVDQLVRP